MYLSALNLTNILSGKLYISVNDTYYLCDGVNLIGKNSPAFKTTEAYKLLNPNQNHLIVFKQVGDAVLAEFDGKEYSLTKWLTNGFVLTDKGVEFSVIKAGG